MMVDDESLEAWFCREVLPLERSLTAFIRRNWRVPAEVADLVQDVYERVLSGASRGLPIHVSAYVYAIARNHLISRARRDQVVCLDLVADLEGVEANVDELTPERFASARAELRRLQAGLEGLPPRCREIVELRKVKGLSSKDVAARLGIGIDAVDQQTSKGMRALTDFLFGGEGQDIRIERQRSKMRGRHGA
ncbi:RNA polymerase sigma factor [Sphingomonas floccifaciens]|uniref:RNA polymerase sigma factor n=1 Tax=Sphingomonas floccifaciens TaxID=1844115 RepID=A0ABW4ND39_9SPHN